MDQVLLVKHYVEASCESVGVVSHFVGLGEDKVPDIGQILAVDGKEALGIAPILDVDIKLVRLPLFECVKLTKECDVICLERALKGIQVLL